MNWGHSLACEKIPPEPRIIRQNISTNLHRNICNSEFYHAVPDFVEEIILKFGEKKNRILWGKIPMPGILNIKFLVLSWTFGSEYD